MLGLNGGWILLWSSLVWFVSEKQIVEEWNMYLFQSTYLAKKGWHLIYSPPLALRHWAGLRWRRPIMMLLASNGISEGNWSESLRMHWCRHSCHINECPVGVWGQEIWVEGKIRVEGAWWIWLIRADRYERTPNGRRQAMRDVSSCPEIFSIFLSYIFL